MDAQRRVRLSKALSLALRHKPWLFELELDLQGWTPIQPLLDGLRQGRSEWINLAEQDVREVVETSDKKRFEMEGNRIRALYGHSIPGRIEKVLAEPPAILFHGTPDAALPVIKVVGLKPMSRQYVHLAIDMDMAQQVGRRKGGATVILQIDALVAYQAGTPFYRGNALVWLADYVPPAYIRALPI